MISRDQLKFTVAFAKGSDVLRAQWFLRSAEELARTVRVQGRPIVRNWGGTLIVRDRVVLVSTVSTLELDIGRHGTLEIGERAFVNHGCSISASKLVRIGARSQIGPHCMLMDNSYHRMEPERRLERPESEPIVLGENVWLGARVIVTAGVSIGEGSVVGAGSVVTKDVPPRTFAAGVPAVVVREL